MLELTEKVLPEELPQPRIFSLLLDFLETLEKRRQKHDTLVLAYLVKLLDVLGSMPSLAFCIRCGDNADGSGEKKPALFSIEEGGVICTSCAGQQAEPIQQPLIYQVDVGIIDILKYFQKQPLQAFEKLALDEPLQTRLTAMTREYISYHLDIGRLKSESLLQI